MGMEPPIAKGFPQTSMIEAHQIRPTPGIIGHIQCEVNGVNTGPTLTPHFKQYEFKGINSTTEPNSTKNASPDHFKIEFLDASMC